MAFKVDGVFAETRLSETQRVWYGRLWRAIGIARLNLNDPLVAAGTSAEAIGFAKHYVTALAGAFDAIGDPKLLDDILRYANLLKAKQPYPTMTGKDAAFIVSFEALLAYLFEMNRDVDAAYAAAADFWKAHAEGMLSVSNGVKKIPDENLVHSFVACIETGVWLGLALKNQSYIAQAQQKALVLNQHLRWHDWDAPYFDHRIPITFAGAYVPLGVHESTYLRYTLSGLALMARAGFESVSPRVMVRMTLNVIHESGPLRNRCAGSEALEAAQEKQGASCFGAIIPFDDSREAARRSAAFWRNHSSAQQYVHIPAFMLYSNVSVT